MSWTEERIELLKKLWSEGHSASQIGKALGVSKNSVVGKAHRMKLAARPSPIKRAKEAEKAKKETPAKAAPAAEKPKAPATPKPQPQAKPAVAEKPAPAAATVKPKPVASPAPVQPARPAASAARIEKPAAVAAPKPVTPSVAKPKRQPRKTEKVDPRLLGGGSKEKRRGPKCLWPIGDPGDPDFHFCEAPAIPGKPYCGEHCARAYITKSSSRESSSSSSSSTTEAA